jgi:23S rRNA (uridine2552-2'-O)-methyltransferase
MADRRNRYARPDHFTRKAKNQGFPARSVWKLEEIDRRVNLLAAGMSVLDLGAAPGSWTLYAAGRVGPGGHVVALDLSPITVSLPANVEASTGDILAIDVSTFGARGPFDVVVSDMAPSTTGIPWADQAKSFELFMQALCVAELHTRAGGSFVGKIFMGAELPQARKRLRELFAEERIIRPEGTRSVSSEIFLIGRGRKTP